MKNPTKQEDEGIQAIAVKLNRLGSGVMVFCHLTEGKAPLDEGLQALIVAIRKSLICTPPTLRNNMTATKLIDAVERVMYHELLLNDGSAIKTQKADANLSCDGCVFNSQEVDGVDCFGAPTCVHGEHGDPPLYYIWIKS